jgi:MFS family permease
MALAGPALGAALVSTTGWRGIFVATLPIAALAAVLGWHRLPDRSADAQTTERFGGDLKGMILLGAFTVVSLVGLASLNATALWAIAVATVLALGYWIYSGRVKSPVLARRHFSQMPLGAINVCFGLAFGAALGIDAYLPVYVRGGLGGSEDMAAFSVAFLTVGWTLGSIVSTRLLRRYTERTVSLLGFGTLIPPFVVGLSLYDRMTPLALVFTMAATVGLGVGLQSMSMQSLLYARAATSEVGRASSAHQYLRGLFQTYSAALCGAILLLVVRDRVGEVEEVRRLLNGEAVSGEEVAGAVAYGFRLAHIVPLAFALIGAGIALLLGRHEALPWRRVPAGLVTPAPAAPTRAMDE